MILNCLRLAYIIINKLVVVIIVFLLLVFLYIPYDWNVLLKLLVLHLVISKYVKWNQRLSKSYLFSPKQTTYIFGLLSNSGEKSWPLKFYLQIYGLILFHQFMTLNVFLVRNNKCEPGVNWLLIKLQQSIFWWSLAKESDNFLNFILWVKSLEKLCVDSRLKHSTLVDDSRVIIREYIWISWCWLLLLWVNSRARENPLNV